MGKRKIIQISTIPMGSGSLRFNHSAVYALCDDGTIWELSGKNDTWEQVDISLVITKESTSCPITE